MYVGGFSLDTRAEALQSAFSPFGDIVDIQLPPDPTHSKPCKTMLAWGRSDNGLKFPLTCLGLSARFRSYI